MNSFDDLQKSWLSQPLTPEPDLKAIRSLEDRWEKYHLKSKTSNWLMSIGFLLAFIVITWIYFTFRDRYDWPFEASIIGVNLLMTIFVMIKWRSYGFNRESMDTPGVDFITYRLKRLNWDRLILTRWVWIYNILLWFSMCMYIVEVTKKGTPMFTFLALLITTGYIFGVTLWSKLYRQKRQIATIDALSSELKCILQDIKA